MNRVMILGAGLYQVPLIETAKRMGLETIVVSVPGPYKGFSLADRCYYVDTRDREQILETMRELRERRQEKQPLDMPSAGSTFKRPQGNYAGALIEQAGLRGYRVGDAQVSEKHCGFVVNLGNATAGDVRNLIQDVQEIVYEGSGIWLEPEVRMLGFEEDN